MKGKKRIKILDAKVEGNHLVPTVVKPEGKSAMSYQDYLLGNKEPLFHAS